MVSSCLLLGSRRDDQGILGLSRSGGASSASARMRDRISMRALGASWLFGVGVGVGVGVGGGSMRSATETFRSAGGAGGSAGGSAGRGAAVSAADSTGGDSKTLVGSIFGSILGSIVGSIFGSILCSTVGAAMSVPGIDGNGAAVGSLLSIGRVC